MNSTEGMISRMLAPIKRRVMLVIGRGVLQALKDGGNMQTMQISLLDGELLDGVERVQNYGMTSVPHPGAEAAAVFLQGDRNHGLILAVDDRRYRLTGLEDGEVAMYDDQGQKVHLGRSKTEITTGDTGNPVQIDTDGDVQVTAGGNAEVAAEGNAEIEAAAISLNNADGAGGQVVTTAHPCAYTGNPHPAGSTDVSAGD